MTKNEINNEEGSCDSQLKSLEPSQSATSEQSRSRNIAIGFIFVASATAAIPLLRSNYQSVASINLTDVAPIGNAQADPAPQACELKIPDVGQEVSGQVVRFLTTQEALAMIQINEAHLHGNVSPDYITQRRVSVEVGPAGNKRVTTAIVPDGLAVRVGDTVQFINVHRARGLPCHYIPPLISRVVASEAGGR